MRGSTRLTSRNEQTNVTSSDHLQQPKVYLIPSLLGDVPPDSSLPYLITQIASTLTHFLVEEEKSARQLLKCLLPHVQLRDLSIHKIPQHPTPAQINDLALPLRQGHSVGVLSEAGCPGIADPGREIVLYAHQHGIHVVPLVGPCSMVLALMASGLNGQSWRFVGYLPVENSERVQAILAIDTRVRLTAETQIMMETPYRNNKLLNDLLQHCNPETLLCIAQGLTTQQESVKTRSVATWRAAPPELGKVPSLFLLGALCQGNPRSQYQ